VWLRIRAGGGSPEGRRPARPHPRPGDRVAWWGGRAAPEEVTRDGGRAGRAPRARCRGGAARTGRLAPPRRSASTSARRAGKEWQRPWSARPLGGANATREHVHLLARTVRSANRTLEDTGVLGSSVRLANLPAEHVHLLRRKVRQTNPTPEHTPVLGSWVRRTNPTPDHVGLLGRSVPPGRARPPGAPTRFRSAASPAFNASGGRRGAPPLRRQPVGRGGSTRTRPGPSGASTGPAPARGERRAPPRRRTPAALGRLAALLVAGDPSVDLVAFPAPGLLRLDRRDDDARWRVSGFLTGPARRLSEPPRRTARRAGPRPLLPLLQRVPGPARTRARLGGRLPPQRRRLGPRGRRGDPVARGPGLPDPLTALLIGLEVRRPDYRGVGARSSPGAPEAGA